MSRDPAFARFVGLQLARLAGAALALLGAVITSHGQPGLAHLPDWLGAVLFVGGAVVFFVVPYVLAKYWKAGR